MFPHYVSQKLPFIMIPEGKRVICFCCLLQNHNFNNSVLNETFFLEKVFCISPLFLKGKSSWLLFWQLCNLKISPVSHMRSFQWLFHLFEGNFALIRCQEKCSTVKYGPSSQNFAIFTSYNSGTDFNSPLDRNFHFVPLN